MLEVRLLGQFDVRRDSVTPIAIPSRPAQSLLAFLLLNPAIEHRREKLAGLLWSDATEKNARSNLRHALWQLRDAIELKRTRAHAAAYLLVDDISIAFNAKSEYWLDVSVLQAAGRENASADDLINAVHLYAGELLPGFYDDWVVPERERLRSVFEQRMAQLLERLRDEQRWAEVLEEAERWIALGQSPEAAYRALMIAHSQVGEMSQVAAVYQRCVQALRNDVGVEPSEQTRLLFEQLKTGIQATSLSSKRMKSPLIQSETISKVPTASAPPTGTVTFLFTDIEASTQAWEKHPELMQSATKRHEEIIRRAVETHGGFAYKFIGDAFQVAFATAPVALFAAIEAQRGLETEDWKGLSPLRVRMALHTGVTEERGDDYVGLVLNRTARLLSAGHGGQILLSQTTYDLARDQLPPTIILRDLGEYLLRDLVRPEHIFQVVATDLPSDFPQLRTPHSVPTNLPSSLSSFIGRQHEIAQVTELLDGARILTLTGPGGVGKTRLAMEVGANIVDRFSDGVWLVELAPLSDPALLPQTIAAALGLREQAAGSIENTILEHVAQKNLLLILDNCEHMIDACARLSATFLSAGAHLKIIATSRQALNIGGEIVWQVPSLSVPKSDQADEDAIGSESVRLFNERAHFVLPSFGVTPANVKTVVQICQRLDGLPLAIELAAARVDMQSLAEINTGMDNRFRLLTGGNRAVLPRHQTLSACLDWSWTLLSSAEQAFLSRLSVFSGTWTLVDAEQVCSDERLNRDRVLELLATLVRKSLVSVHAREKFTSYRLLETIRLYAYERLNDAEATRLSTRHRDWYLHLAEEFWAQMSTKKQAGDWTARLSPELDNLRAALEWCQKETSGADKGLRLSGALGRFWEKQNALTEGRHWLSKFLDLTKNSPDDLARARALYAAGRLAHLQGDDAEAITFYEQCLKIERQDAARLAQTHLDLGEALYRRADYESASNHLDQAVQLGETIHDSVLVALAQMRLGMVYHEHGDLERAVANHRRSLEAFQMAGEQQYAAAALVNLGRVYHERSDYEHAIEHYLQAIRLFESLDNRYSLCIAYNNLGDVYVLLGNFTEAVAYLIKSMRIAEMMENDMRQAVALGSLAECQVGLGDFTLAMEYVTRALQHIQKAHAPPQEGVIYRIRGEIRAALGQAGEAQKDFETARGLLEPLNERSKLARLYGNYGKFLMSEASTQPQGIANLERALGIFQALGSTKEVEKTKTLLHAAANKRS